MKYNLKPYYALHSNDVISAQIESLKSLFDSWEKEGDDFASKHAKNSMENVQSLTSEFRRQAQGIVDRHGGKIRTKPDSSIIHLITGRAGAKELKQLDPEHVRVFAPFHNNPLNDPG